MLDFGQPNMTQTFSKNSKTQPEYIIDYADDETTYKLTFQGWEGQE